MNELRMETCSMLATEFNPKNHPSLVRTQPPQRIYSTGTQEKEISSRKIFLLKSFPCCEDATGALPDVAYPSSSNLEQWKNGVFIKTKQRLSTYLGLAISEFTGTTHFV